MYESRPPCESPCLGSKLGIRVGRKASWMVKLPWWLGSVGLPRPCLSAHLFPTEPVEDCTGRAVVAVAAAVASSWIQTWASARVEVLDQYRRIQPVKRTDYCRSWQLRLSFQRHGRGKSR